MAHDVWRYNRYRTNFFTRWRIGAAVCKFSGSNKQRYSLCLQRVVADFGADSTFGSVLKKMVEHYGIMIPDGAPRKITEEHGKIY